MSSSPKDFGDSKDSPPLWVNLFAENQFANRLYNRAHLLAAAIEYGAEVVDFGLGKYQQALPGVARGEGCRYPDDRPLALSASQTAMIRGWSRFYKKWIPLRTGTLGALWRVAYQHRPERFDPDHPQSCRLDSEYFRQWSRGKKIIYFDGMKVLHPYALLKHQDRVREKLRLSDEAHAYARQLLGGVKPGVKIIGVHIRHTDFKTAARGQGFFSTEQYVRFARDLVADFARQGRLAQVVVCSDGDLAEMERAFAEFSAIISRGDFAADMAVLGACDLIVGARHSTYCTWAAWWYRKPIIQLTQELSEQALTVAMAKTVQIPWEYVLTYDRDRARHPNANTPSKAPPRVGFAFTRGRRAQMQRAGATPREFWYGAQDGTEHGREVTLIEQDDYQPEWRSFLAVKLRILHLLIRRQIEAGMAGHFFLRAGRTLTACAVAVGVSDTPGLSLAYLKQFGFFRGQVVFVVMGLGERLRRLSAQPGWLNRYVERSIRAALRACACIVTLGDAEREFYQRWLGDDRVKVTLIPFGIDVRFWNPGEAGASRPARSGIVFVGNDQGRNFKLFKELCARFADIPVTVVSKAYRDGELPAHVTHWRGEIHGKALTDEALRELYRTAALVILPMKPTLQPSGQSVALQAMACGAPVVISRFEGLWERDHLRDGETLFLIDDRVDPCGVWERRVRDLLAQGDQRERVATAALRLVHQRYTSEHFSRQLWREIAQLSAEKS